MTLKSSKPATAGGDGLTNCVGLGGFQHPKPLSSGVTETIPSSLVEQARVQEIAAREAAKVALSLSGSMALQAAALARHHAKRAVALHRKAVAA